MPADEFEGTFRRRCRDQDKCTECPGRPDAERSKPLWFIYSNHHIRCFDDRANKVGERRRIFFKIDKIISGGQTGVDRGALDVALELGIPCGGWCPKGRKSEDGRIDARYPLQETFSKSYRTRTERNVKESDGTLILTWGQPKEGTALTLRFAQAHKKPNLVIDLAIGGNPKAVENWAKANEIRVLNIAGPRESQFPGIHGLTVDFLRTLFNGTRK